MSDYIDYVDRLNIVPKMDLSAFYERIRLEVDNSFVITEAYNINTQKARTTEFTYAGRQYTVQPMDRPVGLSFYCRHIPIDDCIIINGKTIVFKTLNLEEFEKLIA